MASIYDAVPLQAERLKQAADTDLTEAICLLDRMSRSMTTGLEELSGRLDALEQVMRMKAADPPAAPAGIRLSARRLRLIWLCFSAAALALLASGYVLGRRF